MEVDVVMTERDVRIAKLSGESTLAVARMRAKSQRQRAIELAARLSEDALAADPKIAPLSKAVSDAEARLAQFSGRDRDALERDCAAVAEAAEAKVAALQGELDEAALDEALAGAGFKRTAIVQSKLETAKRELHAVEHARKLLGSCLDEAQSQLLGARHALDAAMYEARDRYLADKPELVSRALAEIEEGDAKREAEELARFEAAVMLCAVGSSPPQADHRADPVRMMA